MIYKNDDFRLFTEYEKKKIVENDENEKCKILKIFAHFGEKKEDK